MRRAIIRGADKVLLEAITECLLNICKDTIKISPKRYKKVREKNIRDIITKMIRKLLRNVEYKSGM